MNRLRIGIFALVALVQISVPAWMIWNRHHTLRDGRLWKFKAAPIDPNDPFRGRYVSLRFAAEEFPQSEKLALTVSKNVYVRLTSDADGFAQIESVSEQRLSGNDVVRADNASHYEGKQHVTLPFDQYLLDETVAPEADRAYAENSRRGVDNAYVTVRVLDGDAALEQLFIGGMPLRDYPRRNAADSQPASE